MRTGDRSEFPIVGIGASAGGLEAFTQLLTHLPTHTGMAFVLIQHLDPKHESMSVEILSRTTHMKVTEVKQGTHVEPNCIYIIPPNFRMGILHGALTLFPRIEVRGHQHLVIDFFLQSLAEDLKHRAVGVVLSGAGSDGTEGLSAIKAKGGITFAQDPKTAKFDTMPLNAIASGSVDLILSPQQIAEEIGRLAHHSYVVPAAIEEQAVEVEDPSISTQDSLSHIVLLIRNLCHVDFTLYKTTTIKRRIERRMMLNKMNSLKSYTAFLSKNPDEVKALYADILIHVTSFFRDPEAFQELKTKIFPKLMESRVAGIPIRIWVPGCSTGEEAYSIAIALVEFLGKKISQTPIQIFASDISELAIQKARIGKYSETISRHISTDRLKRFFIRMEDGGSYKIAKSIRDLCVFSRHSVINDPPFAKIDLISCRNLLIYFTATLQKHVIPIFHYSLTPKGFLWLGQAESIAGFSDLFAIINKTHKLYVKKDTPITLSLNFPTNPYVPGKQTKIREPVPFAKAAIDTKAVAEQILQTQYPGFLINEEMEILQFLGNTSHFVQHSPGAPSYNILKVIRSEFSRDLRMALQMAKKHTVLIKKDGLSFKEGRKLKTFTLKVIPSKPSKISKECYYLIIFEDATESTQTSNNQIIRSKRGKSGLTNRKDPYLIELENELLASQEYQHSLIEKYETTQEDLTTANEELQSANEELQSTNEELETAKEELQSGNEELTTVNDELQVRSFEQNQTNNDLVNLLGSVQIPIVMLGKDRKIRRFTPLAGKFLNLIPTDVGRPIGDLRLNFSSPGAHFNLDELVSNVIETMNSTEEEVQDVAGRWYRLQSRPYKTLDGRIDGAVLALVDINDLKQSLQEIKLARSEAEKANRAKDLFLAMLSHELRTPLTAILSWAQLLQSGTLDSGKIKRAGQMIEDCGNTQKDLINDLLDVSRIIVGKVSLEINEVNPIDIVSRSIESVRSTAEKNSIKIETFFDPKAGTVMADAMRLKQVFSNLLTNAIKFSSPNSKIWVRVERGIGHESDKAKIRISVGDSGKGIRPEFLPHIFDRFSQEDNSSIRMHGGLGLGLSIVRNLIELQGGIVLAESAGENLGATFTVILPVKSDFNSLSNQQVLTKSMNNPLPVFGDKMIRLDGLRVLIVDDQASSREVFTESLRSLGAETLAANSAQEGLRMFTQFQPHVLVSDIAMPGEDGYSLIRKIRGLSSKKLSDTPAIALTAYSSKEDVKQAISAGFQAHLVKPVDGYILAKTISNLAGQK